MLASPQLASATEVRIEVAYGNVNGTIDIELYDDLAPKTVMNFLRYAGRGDYTTNGLFHFVASGQAIRAGGFTYVEVPDGESMIPIFFHIPEDPPISDEVSPPLLNARGTIAMFKPPNEPERITSEWTINLSDNINSINNVFGQVIAGMDVAEAIGGLSWYRATNTHAAFTNIPLVNFDNTGPILAENLVRVLRIPNVASTRVPAGDLAIFTADVDMTFDSIGTVDPATSTTLLLTFKSPPDSQVHFNNDMILLSLSGPTGPARVVTMYDGSSVRPTHYYAYGSTPDDPSLHWYDFAFDGMTGAEIKSDRIVLHFVAGERGDYDRTVDGKIDHTGAQAVVTPIASSQSGGCSITITPSRATRGGEWILISVFLAFLAIRRRIHRKWLQ
jgi:cyclophilin family peptidyl-prolyl cis-trans isomerase